MARFRFYIWSYGSKLGIEWDKITDKEIETNTKPKKKGIEIAYVDKDVSVEMKGKQSLVSWVITWVLISLQRLVY